jgi:HK97 family phage prohead protease
MTPALEFLAPLEAKLAGATGEIEGFASTFGNVDLHGDIVAAGAFRKSLAEHRAANSMPAMLWSHDVSAPVGVWLDARETDQGLKMRGRLTLETQRGAEARALAKDGALALSIGFRTRDAAFEKGRRILKDVQLFETSLVAMPANPLARLSAVKSAIATGQKLGPRELEKALHEILGLPKAFARRLIAGGFNAANSDRCDAEGEAVHRLVEAVKADTASLNSFLRTHQHGNRKP